MAWVKNGTPHTLTSANSVVTISDLTAKKFNQFLFHEVNPSSSTGHLLTFNNNTNPVYARRNSSNGGADATGVSESNIVMGHSVTSDGFFVSHCCSISGQEKLVITWYAERSTSGAGTAPNRREQVSKFVPSPDADITSVKYTLDAGQTYDTDSNLSALGTTGGEVLSTPKIQTGCEFHETDTNKDYVWNGSSWVYITP